MNKARVRCIDGYWYWKYDDMLCGPFTTLDAALDAAVAYVLAVDKIS